MAYRETGKGSGMGAGSANGSYKGPKMKSTTARGSYMDDGDSVGVKDGLNELYAFDAEEATAPEQNYKRDPLTGNANERHSENPKKSSGGKSKGVSFEFC